MSENIVENNRLKISASSLRAYTMIGALILIWLYFHWATGGIFLTPRNLSNLTLQTSVTGILAVGMLLIIVAGQIDLSIGSLLGLTGGIAAILSTNYDFGLLPSILGAVAVGIAVGFLQGSLVAYFGIPAFIVTLGGLLAWRGTIKGVTESNTIPVSDANFEQIGQSYVDANIGWILAAVAILLILFSAFRQKRHQREAVFDGANDNGIFIKAIISSLAVIAFIFVMNSYEGVPIPVLILLAVALAGAFLSNRTTFGRYLYAIGGNAEAARLSGINIRANIIKVFVLMGFLTAIAALIFTSRNGSATPEAGTLKELDAIAACVIGGASLMGGRGTIFGACLGALIMASLDNGMSLLNIRDFMQEIVKGTILVLAVGLDMIGKND